MQPVLLLVVVVLLPDAACELPATARAPYGPNLHLPSCAWPSWHKFPYLDKYVRPHVQFCFPLPPKAAPVEEAPASQRCQPSRRLHLRLGIAALLQRSREWLRFHTLQALRESLRWAGTSLISLLLFKPPVGIVVLLEVYRRLRRKSVLEDARTFFPRNRARSFDLDAADREYELLGGVEATRVSLLKQQLVREALAQGVDLSAEDELAASCLRPLLAALGLSCPPRGAREDFVHKTAVLLGEWRAARTRHGESAMLRGSVVRSLLLEAEAAVEVRVADALLRLLRERLLTTARELRVMERRCKAGLRDAALWSQIRMRAGGAQAVAERRRRLALTSALYDAQLQRLGAVQRLLLTRPPPLSDAALLQEEEELGGPRRTGSAGHAPDGVRSASEDEERPWRAAARLWVLEARALTSDTLTAALRSVSAAHPLALPSSNPEEDARAVAKGELASVDDALGEEAVALHAWAASGSPDGWDAALLLLGKLAEAQRTRARRLLPFAAPAVPQAARSAATTASLLVAAAAVHRAAAPHWPTAVALATTLRDVALGITDRRFITPLRSIALDLLNRRARLTDQSALDDAEASLATMLRDFVHDVRRRGGDPEEDGESGGGEGENSKGNLSDRSGGSGGGGGDGGGSSGGKAEEAKTVPMDRRGALAVLDREYEAELRSGAVRGLLTGKMVRILLIQVQQLKAQLLSGLGAIDELVDANRLNVQLVAAIPAVLLFLLSSRALVASMFALRTRTLRSTRAAHAEMGELLARMQRCLLLAAPPPPPVRARARAAGTGASRAWSRILTGHAPSLAEAAEEASRADAQSVAHGTEGAPTPPTSTDRATEGRALARGDATRTDSLSAFSRFMRWLRGTPLPPTSQTPQVEAASNETSVEPSSTPALRATLTPHVRDEEALREALSGDTTGTPVLDGAALGEFVLLSHSYLLLLSLASPPLSRKLCDALHHDVQDLLWHQRLTTLQQEKLLRVILNRHAALLK